MAHARPDVADVTSRYFRESVPAGLISAYLFGSHAYGRAHVESDVDIAVVLSWHAYPTARDRFEERLRLYGHLMAHLRTDRVDLIVLNDAPPHLGRRVVATGQRLFCSDPERDHAFVRDVQLRARSIPLPRSPGETSRDPTMTYLVERLLELRRYLDHLHQLRLRFAGRETLDRDLSLHNDVLFSLLTVCQLVIDIAGELSARAGERFEDYKEAVRGLARDPRFPVDLVRELERLPGFRNVLVREYVNLDLDRVIEAMDRLEPIERFCEIVRRIETGNTER